MEQTSDEDLILALFDELNQLAGSNFEQQQFLEELKKEEEAAAAELKRLEEEEKKAQIKREAEEKKRAREEEKNNANIGERVKALQKLVDAFWKEHDEAWAAVEALYKEGTEDPDTGYYIEPDNSAYDTALETFDSDWESRWEELDEWEGELSAKVAKLEE